MPELSVEEQIALTKAATEKYESDIAEERTVPGAMAKVRVENDLQYFRQVNLDVNEIGRDNFNAIKSFAEGNPKAFCYLIRRVSDTVREAYSK